MFRVLLSIVSTFALYLRHLRFASQYISERCNGLQYGSYSLEDEVALALSLANNSGGGIIIDAGANTGSYTQVLLRSNMTFKQIVMIEPAPTLRESLYTFVQNNQSVSFEPVAIGAESGSLELYFYEEGSALASLYQRDLTHIGIVNVPIQSVSVPVVTLDSIAAKYGIETIDYLKLDLEGHELQALIGARQLLNERRIKALSFEFGGCNIDSRTYIKDFWQLLVYQYQFSFYRLAPRRHLIRLSHYSESLERFSWQNILACAPGVVPKWRVIE